MSHELGQKLTCIGARLELMMLCAEGISDDASVCTLVVEPLLLAGEDNGERLWCPVALAHRSDNGARVDAAGEEAPHGNIRNESQLAGVGDELPEPLRIGFGFRF